MKIKVEIIEIRSDQTTHIGLNGENTLDDWNILKFELKYNIWD